MSTKPFKKTPLKKILNITDVITILYYELSPSFSTAGEKHDFWEMLYVERGQVSCSSGNEAFTLHQGELFFHQPNFFHKISCDGVHGASIFIISFCCKSRTMQSLTDKAFVVNNQQTKIIKRLIGESLATFVPSEYPLSELNEAPLGGRQLIRSYLEELLIFLIRGDAKTDTIRQTEPERSHLNESLAQKIEDYLTVHMRGKISLDELCERFHYGKSSLCDIFKRTYGETIMGFHTRLKIEAAKRMLFEKKMTVSEVSEHLGFESPEYFSRTFKKLAGISPRAFKTSLAGDNRVYLENELVLNK